MTADSDTIGDFANPKLVEAGIKRIEWAAREMPVIEQIRERFAREVAALRRISHSNVTRVHEAGEVDGVPVVTFSSPPTAASRTPQATSAPRSA